MILVHKQIEEALELAREAFEAHIEHECQRMLSLHDQEIGRWVDEQLRLRSKR